MGLEDWIIFAAIPATIALWRFLEKKMWPMWTKRLSVEAESDAEVEASALSSVIELNQQLTQDVIETKNQKLEELKALIQYVVQDKTRIDDIINDIEQHLNSVEQQTYIITETGRRQGDLITVLNINLVEVIDRLRAEEDGNQDF